MSGSEATGRLLDFVCGDWRPDAETRAAARVFLLDSLGVGLSGARLPWSRSLVQMAGEGWSDGGGVCVWGGQQRLSPPHAAMVNAYQMHSQEFDCVHEEAVVHPMAVVLACLLAQAERQGGVSGGRLLTAVCVSVEVAALLGVASGGAMRFFRPGICGGLAATAGMARLAGMDLEQTRSALGIAYSQLGGTMQAHLEGSPTLPMQIAFNARNAVAAIDMAQAGLQGPRDFLQGQFGFYRLFEQPGDLDAAFARLGSGEIRHVSHKVFPTGRAAQGALSELQQLMQGGVVRAEQVDQVRLLAPPLICRLVDRPARPDMEPSYARLCLGYLAAAMLLHGRLEVTAFDPEALRSQAWHELAGRVVVAPNDIQDPNAMVPQQVLVRLKDGRTLDARVSKVLGSPQNPLSPEQHMEKFFGCAASGSVPRERAQAIAEMVEDIERLDEVRRLADLLHGAAHGGQA